MKNRQTLAPKDLKQRVRKAGITHQEIADKYGCFRAFVSMVLARRDPCPPRMVGIIEQLIAEKERDHKQPNDSI